MTEMQLIEEFLAYLESRDLSVCNYTKNGAGFWPVGLSHNDLATAFMNAKSEVAR